jgi:predicted acetylornithine/succinylornithine family transaminase
VTLLDTYNRAPLTIVAGEGCELIDDRGRRYLDFIGGLAVSALGHAHPVIAEAVAKQARTLTHASNLYHHEPSGELSRELVKRSGMNGVFFCNSGTEANEAAFKLARKSAFRRGERDRTKILACSGSFHGRTFGSLAATANSAYREGFGPLPSDFEFVTFNDAEALRRAFNNRIAAFIVEPVQGESGVHPADQEFLREARRLCDENGALLIFDEIQCGMGRTGSLFAFEQLRIRPDILTIAKSLANGLPIGAVLANDRAARGFSPGDHGSTFGGSPIPCAAALAHLHLRDGLDLNANVKARAAQFADALEALAAAEPLILDAPRTAGLLIGMTIKEPFRAQDLVSATRDEGLLIGSAGGNSIRFAPPLIVSEDEVRSAASIFASAVRKLSAVACVTS